MKKIFLIVCLTLCCTACVKEQNQLLKLTDKYVKNINIDIGLFDIPSDNTPNNTWKVGRVGRMIIVKSNDYISSNEYEKTKNMLKRHYKNRAVVRDVYINEGGTITIDCRY